MKKMTTYEKEKSLEDVGLSKNESKVYITMIDIGPSTVTKIAEKSGVHRTNVYDTLEKLKDKGLVSFISQDDKKIFQASDPKSLFNVLREKEDVLKEVLPQLILSQQLSKSGSFAQIFEGVKAVQNILDHFLDIGETRYAYGVPKIASETLGPFIEHYHKRRVAKKLAMKMIYNSDAKSRIQFLNSLPLTESRYLLPEYDSPAQTNICGDEVVIIVWSKRPSCIQIKSSDVANSYRKYFDILWCHAQKDN